MLPLINTGRTCSTLRNQRLLTRLTSDLWSQRVKSWLPGNRCWGWTICIWWSRLLGLTVNTPGLSWEHLRVETPTVHRQCFLTIFNIPVVKSPVHWNWGKQYWLNYIIIRKIFSACPSGRRPESVNCPESPWSCKLQRLYCNYSPHSLQDCDDHGRLMQQLSSALKLKITSLRCS